MSGVFRAVICILTSAWLTLTPALAQSFLPQTVYDPSIPTVEAVLGKPSGQRITPSADVIRYFRALERAAPGRIVVKSYGKSWQGRELVYAVLGSPARLARLPEISSDLQALADPRRTSKAEAEEIISRSPGTVWLAHGVHGDEISSSDAAMMTAYHLLAARGDPLVDKVLGNTLVFIDPIQNPDGRDRFVNGYYDTLGLEPSGDAIAAERDQPWPGGRYNHYLFDMNRDWFALTQPETVGRVRIFQEWMPLVFVDLHEMGPNSTYFFSPEADPYNPGITPGQRDTLRLIGRNNASWFDRFGFSYFTSEVYDDFYPGYGAGWPLFQGTIGTTYEQAGADGLLARRSDGSTFTYQDTVRRHFTSSIATLETVANNRERLLRNFYDYRSSAIAEGRSGKTRSYLIPPQLDQSSADKLMSLLVQQGADVRQSASEFRSCGVSYPAGTYAVSLAQPAGRLIKTLMDPNVPLDPKFMAEQERRRAKDLETELYDVTAWSLPLMFNVKVDLCGEDVAATLPSFNGQSRKGAISRPEASYGFLAPWGSTSAIRLLAGALRQGMPVSSADVGFTHAGVAYPAGTLIFRNSATPDLAARLSELAATTGASLSGIDDSWITDGPSFGSSRVVNHTAPRIAIAWDTPTKPSAAGNLRFVIEQQFGYPVTPVRTKALGSDDLARFDVLILPDGGGYARVLGESGTKALAGWMRRGGVLIAIGGAAQFVADPKSGLASLRRETAWRATKAEKEGDTETVPGALLTSSEQLLAAETPREEAPDASPGVLVRASPDRDHWLAVGLKPQLNVLMTGSDIYSPVRRDEGTNVVSFTSQDELVASGYLWEETKRQLAFKPFVVAEPEGRGQLIVFTQDPSTRAYLDGLNVLLANAIFRGPAHARPPR